MQAPDLVLPEHLAARRQGVEAYGQVPRDPRRAHRAPAAAVSAAEAQRPASSGK